MLILTHGKIVVISRSRPITNDSIFTDICYCARGSSKWGYHRLQGNSLLRQPFSALRRHTRDFLESLWPVSIRKNGSEKTVKDNRFTWVLKSRAQKVWVTQFVLSGSSSNLFFGLAPFELSKRFSNQPFTIFWCSAPALAVPIFIACEISFIYSSMLTDCWSHDIRLMRFGITSQIFSSNRTMNHGLLYDVTFSLFLYEKL